MIINNLELDKIVFGIRKVSEVVYILYDFYKGPELTPMLDKLIKEIREVMDQELFIGEVKKNTIVKPYVQYLINEIQGFKKLKHSEFKELMWLLEGEQP